MHPDRPIQNWWTPERVRVMLSRYGLLAEAIDGLRAQDFLPYESFGSPPGEATFGFAVQTKADLDRAIAALDPRLRRVAELRWQQQWDPLEVGDEVGVRERKAWYLVADARDEITKKLCEAVQ